LAPSAPRRDRAIGPDRSSFKIHDAAGSSSDDGASAARARRNVPETRVNSPFLTWFPLQRSAMAAMCQRSRNAEMFRVILG
jgi:hypothetical protein